MSVRGPRRESAAQQSPLDIASHAGDHISGRAVVGRVERIMWIAIPWGFVTAFAVVLTLIVLPRAADGVPGTILAVVALEVFATLFLAAVSMSLEARASR